MARSDIHTHLALDRFAEIMGMNPMHFNGAQAPNTEVLPLNNSCSDLTPQYAWQYNGRTGRHEIAMAIQVAEQEIAEFLKVPPSLDWYEQERVDYPTFLDRQWGAPLAATGAYKSVHAQRGKIYALGRRATTLIDTATVAGGELTFVDEDGDGFAEIAQIVVTTTVTDPKEIKVYFAGKAASPLWEVRRPKSLSISGGSVTIKFWVWQVIDPDKWEALPDSQGYTAINVEDTSNLVTSLDVYRVYNDTTQASVSFVWGSSCTTCGGSGCPVCSLTTQDGCAVVLDSDMGILRPFPASYNSDDGTWYKAAWTVGREPAYVNLWYQAGLVSADYEKGYTLDPMPITVAQAITYLVAARMERDISECSNVSNMQMWLREDMTRLTEGASFFTQKAPASNPFGTHRGEIMAWRLLDNFIFRRGHGGGVV